MLVQLDGVPLVRFSKTSELTFDLTGNQLQCHQKTEIGHIPTIASNSS